MWWANPPHDSHFDLAANSVVSTTAKKDSTSVVVDMVRNTLLMKANTSVHRYILYALCLASGKENVSVTKTAPLANRIVTLMVTGKIYRTVLFLRALRMTAGKKIKRMKAARRVGF